MKGETHKCPVCENQTATVRKKRWRCHCGAAGDVVKTNWNSNWLAVRERPAQPKEEG